MRRKNNMGGKNGQYCQDAEMRPRIQNICLRRIKCFVQKKYQTYL